MTDESRQPTVQQLLDLSGKTALITGASGYLGQALASGLAEAGARVIATSRDAARAATAAAALPDPHSVSHLGFVLDHQEPESIDECLEQITREAGSLDILVNNGHEGLANDWTDVTSEQFTRQLVNASGYFQLAREVRNLAVQQDRPASIILLGSMYGQVASYPDTYQGLVPASPVAYHALKGAIIHMTRHLAVYWAPDRIRVNCLSPGPFPPPRVSRELVGRLEGKSPMGRMGEPHELKGALLLLASDAGSYITGQNLVVDGGWTAW